MKNPNLNRRTFLKSAGIISASILTLRDFSFARDLNQPLPVFKGYGDLIPDPQSILDLPKGFSYTVLSKAGRRMDDGFITPGKHDGMAAFQGPEGRIILVCNHENNPDDFKYSPFGENHELLNEIPKNKLYDYGNGKSPGLGGTTTVVYNPKTKKVEKEFLSLAGTHRNCAGGATPWNTWVTCEESFVNAGGLIEQNHGYNFEVPATTEISLADPVPLRAMGRFNHEAIAVDPQSGVVYQTEDRGDSLIYRFIPDVPGELGKGGKLQALVIKTWPGCDTRNWEGLNTNKFPIGQDFEVEWMDMEDVESSADDLRYRGYKNGAARFARGEGMMCGQGDIYWACTNGGELMKGQVFKYSPSPYEGTERENEAPAKLQLYLQPNNINLVENSDNIAAAPDGGIIVCEDDTDEVHDEQYLVGVTPNGEFYRLARNATGNSEFAGACVSADGNIVFVNLQYAGLTVAITGPFMWL